MARHLSLPGGQRQRKQVQLGAMGFRASRSDPLLPQCTAGMKKCPYCKGPPRFFTPQGYASHEKTHIANGDRFVQSTKYGKVKVHGVADAVGGEVAGGGRDEEGRGGVAAGGGSDAADGGVAREGGDAAEAEVAGGGGDATGGEVAGGGGDAAGGEVAGGGRDVAGGGGQQSGKRKRAANAKAHEIVGYLDQWHAFDGSKKQFCKDIGYEPVQLRRWLKNEEKHRDAAKVQDVSVRRHQGVAQESCGKYPEMEAILAANVKAIRAIGIPVEAWMVEYEGKMAFHRLHPSKFPEPDLDANDDNVRCPIKFSQTWKRNFMDRKQFSFRKVGTRMNKKGVAPGMMESLRDYHTVTRVFQLSEMLDPEYGKTSPENVFTHDQIPIELVDRNERTIDVTGVSCLLCLDVLSPTAHHLLQSFHFQVDSVFDSTSGDKDEKRFCTLNLFGAMRHRADGKNVPAPHIIFRASKFQTADEGHDRNEAEEWDPRVRVSFHPNAWCDAQTHMHGVREVLGPVNQHLQDEGSEMRGVVFEDNLSSHRTDAVFDFWETEMDMFEPPRFVPPNMTDIVQVIDRHIGIRYKRAVYRAFRKELMKRMKAARAAAGTSDGVVIAQLTPREKRIIITKAIANEHAKLTRPECVVYERGFVATGTWLPVNHLVRDEDGNCAGPVTIPAEAEVKLQHLPEYRYVEQVPRAAVHAAIDAQKEEAARAAAEKARRAAEETEHLEAERLLMEPFVEKAASVMVEIETYLTWKLPSVFEKIRAATSFDQFVVGGSFASAELAEAVAIVCLNDESVDTTKLVANDIDTYHGRFTEDPDAKLNVHLNANNYLEVEGIELEVNTVECDNLSPATLLANNDLNITGSCIGVDFDALADGGKLFTIHASPQFWTFLFQKRADRVIKPMDTFNVDGYGATTCVRLAFKAFQMQSFRFSLCGVDLTKGTLAESQKKKFDQMKDWVDSPFLEYACRKPHKNRNVFVIEKKHEKIPCACCETERANKKCSYKMCKKCCVKHCVENADVDLCKEKSHARAAVDARLAEEEEEMEIDEGNEEEMD